MNERNNQPEAPEREERQPFEEPRLSYVQPKLREHGKVEEITLESGGFFGTFSP